MRGTACAVGKDQRCDQAVCPREAPDHGVRELVSAGQGRAQQPSPEPERRFESCWGRKIERTAVTTLRTGKTTESQGSQVRRMPSTCAIFRRSLHPRCTPARASGHRQRSHTSALPNHAILVIKSGAAARRHWPGVIAALCLGRPARRTPGRSMQSAQINEAHTLRRPVQRSARFLGFDCPARGHRHNGGPCGRVARDRLSPNPDPGHSQGWAPARNEEQRRNRQTRARSATTPGIVGHWPTGQHTRGGQERRPTRVMSIPASGLPYRCSWRL